MSTFKKLLALTLALAMVLSVSAFAGYKADTYADADKIDEDCEDAVELMYALDIMVGDGKNFNPESTVTRAEMAKMIYVVLNYGDDDKAANYTGAKIFSDVASGAWYEGYVNYCGTTKLVQGRPDGTFGPMDPVTCAEAAKMLLTAIGYSAAERGYTGAEWANNVLSDAALVGLLNNYNYNTNTYAPRQWVAVMMENALFEAYTYSTVRPVIVNGLLTSSVIGKVDEDTYTTMGEKYYHLNRINRIAVATPDAYIEGNDLAGSDKVLFQKADGTGKVQLKNTGLKAADLGQNYCLIYNTDNMKAYSVRSLSETAEARTLDIEVDVKYGTSSNKAANKYEFTIDEMVATFEAYEINVLYTGVDGYADTYVEDGDTYYYTANDEITVDDLRAMIEDPARNNNTWKAIDTDADGKIDYFFVTEYDYASVEDADTHKKYGDYIVAEDLTSGDELEFNNETRLYIEDCIISEDEIVEDNVVKYTWSLDDGQYVMEVLPLSEEVEYESRDAKKAIYELGGEDYQVADEAVAGIESNVLKAKNLGELVDFVSDGDLLVWAALSDSNYTDIADINAQLVLVLDVMDEYSNGKIREQNAIEYMTIDGESHIAGYQDGEGIDFDELSALADVQDKTKRDDDESDWLGKDADNTYAIERRLFILKEGTKGRVYLKALDETKINEQLDASTSVLDGYVVYGDGRAVDGKLDATGSTVKLNGDKLAAEHNFFYGYFNSYGEAIYGVVTPEQLAKGTDNSTYAQVLTLDNAKGTRTTVVGGYIFTPDMQDDIDDGYLFIDEILRETEDGQPAKVTFLDGESAEIMVTEWDYLYEGYLYAYNYNVVDDEYALTVVGMGDTSDEIVDIDGYDVIFTESDDIDVEDATIAIVNIELSRDENADELNDEALFFEHEYVGYQILTADELELDLIVDGEEVDGYVQYTDWCYDADEEVLYVIVFQCMDRYTGNNLNDSPLNIAAPIAE